MFREFEQGKRIVAVAIALILVHNGLGMWLSRTWLLTWHTRLIDSLQEPMAVLSARALRNWLITNQESFLSNHVGNYAILIVCCLMLFLGIDWLRWFLAFYWVVRGLLGLVVTISFAQWIGFSHAMWGVGLLTTLLYLSCGTAVLLAPSVHLYVRWLQRPYVRGL